MRSWPPAGEIGLALVFAAAGLVWIAGAAGMPVWWHNRLHLDRGAAPPPIAEHDTLTPLTAAVLG